MLKSKVYVRGAYGPGNIGDDALMLSMISILKRRFAAHDIAVGVANPELALQLDPDVKWVHLKSPVKAHCVVLGGGGQFFSFDAGRSVKRESARQRLVGLIQRIRAQAGLKDILGRISVRLQGGHGGIYLAKHLSAFCLGFGPFEGPAGGRSRAAAFLGSAGYVSVRDVTSQRYCSDLFGFPGVSVFTDPTLMSSLWAGGAQVNDALLDPDAPVSIIVRDWPLSEHGTRAVETLIRAANVLRASGRTVRLVSLYEQRDRHLIEANPDHEWLVWRPGKQTILAFVQSMVEASSAIVTSRAHGMLLPAALGVPTIGMAIENKIVEVHRMLPSGSLLVDELDADAVLRAVVRFEQNIDALTQGIRSDRARLSLVAQQAVDHFLAWIDSAVLTEKCA